MLISMGCLKLNWNNLSKKKLNTFLTKRKYDHRCLLLHDFYTGFTSIDSHPVLAKSWLRLFWNPLHRKTASSERTQAKFLSVPGAASLSKYRGKEAFYLSSELPDINLRKKKSHYVYINFSACSNQPEYKPLPQFYTPGTVRHMY